MSALTSEMEACDSLCPFQGLIPCHKTYVAIELRLFVCPISQCNCDLDDEI